MQIWVPGNIRLLQYAAILQQNDQRNDYHPYYNESGLWNPAKHRYDVVQNEQIGLRTVDKDVHNYEYGVRFPVEINTSIFMYKLILAANHHSGGPVTQRIMLMLLLGE